jgi:hypothetical protein
MGRLVLQSRELLLVGKIYKGIWDPWCRFLPEQAVKVIAESTAEEWIECLVAFGEEREWAELYAALDPYFYVIQTD